MIRNKGEILKKFTFEREGQEQFYKEYLPLIDKELKEDDVLLDYTDGVVNGNLLEFKLKIDNLNTVLFQAIKYLSRMRINGESVPKNILLLSLNTSECYVYNSEDYLEWIEKQYFGGASVNNEGFVAGAFGERLDYSTPEGSYRLVELLREEEYIKIHIDESCIVGWAERYYRELSGSTKGDFIGDVENKVGGLGEIRNPIHFKNLIYPYEGETNEKFAYLLDKLNDKLTQKETGAFYTPEAYAKKAFELVEMAIERVPEGNDYVIFDFCAGSGNLEVVFPDEVLEHCILSTYEYYEYRVLVQRLGDKVKYIIPPTESMVEYANGFVRNADAMSEEFINNSVVRKYVEDPKMTIIMYENPPYRDSSSAENGSTDKFKSDKKDKFVTQQFKEDIKKYNTHQASSRETSNLFIWRAFKYYLRQPTDSLIVYSPVKYFKSVWLVEKKMIKGFAFNRKHFHASPSVISCILWANEEDKESKSWELEAWDIDNRKGLVLEKKIEIKKVFESFSSYRDFREDESDIVVDFYLGADGYEIPGYRYKKGRVPIFNSNIIGYITAIGYPINAINRRLTRCNTKTELEQSFGFHLRSDNYLEKLPLFVAKLFPQDNWYDKDVYFTTSDGGDAYTKDKDFLKSCLVYTCLSNQNKCLSFTGSDGRYYKNELCFDEDTLATKDLEKATLNKDEEELLRLWRRILENAKKTKKYNEELFYGVYQIDQELNTYTVDAGYKTKKRVYDYPELNGDLITLRTKLKEYYKKHITEKMFKYELIK